MSSEPAHDESATLAPPPQSFMEYVRSFGPGLVIVLTWLGAGDVVTMGISGGNYGYALMWVVVLAVAIRFCFVSLIAKYQLCNQHGEGVLDGLARLHRGYALLLMVVAILMGHFLGAYLVVGVGETWVGLTGMGQTWMWATLWSAITLALVFRPSYSRVELVFKGLLLCLTVSLLGTALWTGPNPRGIVQGTFSFSMPEQVGAFDSMLLTLGMIGAVGGSLMNLAYPYFLEQKGWRGPTYRRVQTYDFLLAVVVMIILNLAVWTLGAELIHGSGETIKDLSGLTRLLSEVLGVGGAKLFYLGVFAAVYTSLVGTALALGYMASHGWLRWKAGAGPLPGDYRTHPIYRVVVVWILVSPLVWTLPNMPGFVTLTLIVSSLQVVLIPFLAGGIWWITASSRYIGREYRNRWWENAFMVFVFGLALWGAYEAIDSVRAVIRGF